MVEFKQSALIPFHVFAMEFLRSLYESGPFPSSVMLQTKNLATGDMVHL